MTITQPSTRDRVSGTIGPGGDYQLRSARESYDGKLTGDRSTATYSYITAGGCTETYEASFVIRLGPPANPLDRIGVRATCPPRRATANRSSHWRRTSLSAR